MRLFRKNIEPRCAYCAKGNAAKVLNLQPGDNIVLTGGPINGQSGNTNTIKVETI